MDSAKRCNEVVYETVKAVNDILDANVVNKKVIEELKSLGTFIGLLSSALDIPILGTIAEIERTLADAMAKKDSQRICLMVVLITHLLKYCDQSVIFQDDCTWISRLIALLKEVHEAYGTNISVCLEIERFLENLDTPHRAFSQPSASDDMYTPTYPFQQLSTPQYPDAFPPRLEPYMPGITNTGPQFLFLPPPPFYYLPVYLFYPL
ncbi:hypothetical protein M3Y95_00846900 [Aphelenchoides besseyi]|nr:hypothetical protein M3Y95_00846900 [Aphelenchoides besseyi]